MADKPYGSAHRSAARKQLVSYFKKKKQPESPIMQAMKKRVKRASPHMQTKARKRRKLVSPGTAAKFRAGFNR